MRLYNEVEETTKVVVVEDYATFNGLLKCKYLFYLLIAYTAFAVINAILAFIDGGYVMAAVNLIVHSSVCASLWMNHLANKELKEDEKPSTKGTKIFQIAHAAKYLVVFILLILGLILIIFSWIDAANVANKELVELQGKLDVEAELAAAKLAVSKVFWGYLFFVIVYLAFSVITLVYYKAVMACVENFGTYTEKGTHFWKDIKFLAIILFVVAGLNVVIGLLSATGALNGWYSMIIAPKDPENPTYEVLAAAVGGTGWLAFVGRVLFAAICVCLGLLLVKGFKVLDTTETSHEEVLELGDNEAPVEVADEEKEPTDEVVQEVLQ